MPEALITFCTFVARLPARTLLAFIWVYQRTLSPVLPVVLGPGCGCRFYPSCSRYAAEAVSTHGALLGAWLAAKRLIKCQPLHPGGFDPVPPPFARPRPTPGGRARGQRPVRPVCTRA